jgi:hypothetical protein
MARILETVLFMFIVYHRFNWINNIPKLKVCIVETDLSQVEQKVTLK